MRYENDTHNIEGAPVDARIALKAEQSIHWYHSKHHSHYVRSSYMLRIGDMPRIAAEGKIPPYYLTKECIPGSRLLCFVTNLAGRRQVREQQCNRAKVTHC